MAPRLFGLFILISLVFPSQAQYFQKERNLVSAIERAASEKERIKALGALAEYYYIYKDERKGDSLLQKQLLLAEVSNDKALIKEVLFNNAIINLNDWASTQTFEKAIAFVDKGLKYAIETGNHDYEAVAHLRKAFIYRKRGFHEQALQQATMALSNASRSNDDSLKVVIYLEVGNVFLGKGDAVSAYKNYNTAYDVAYGNKDAKLLSETYHHFADLYASLSNNELTKQSLLKSLELNNKHNNEYGLINDYIDLARLTDEKEYFDKVLVLADKLNDDRYKLQGKRLMFAYLMAIKKSSTEALRYLNANEDLRQSYLNTGYGNYNWMIGNVYRYSGNIDSALHYYAIAEPHLQKSYDLSVRKIVCKGIAECYERTSMAAMAMQYFERAFDLSRQQNDLKNLSDISASLGRLYAKAGNYQKAYEYGQQSEYYKDTLEKLAAQRDVVMMEVDRENKKHEKDLADAAARTLKARNLQYMGISIAVTGLLILLILAGMFPVSPVIIRLTGFVAFICLFEFIILLIDHWLHQLAHGEPLKIWLCKIVIIGLLMPLHHYIEHGVVRFISSKRLMKVRQKISFRSLLPKKKPAPAVAEAGTESDNMV